MMVERYVLLGLAPARSAWSAAVSRWTTSGALPVEFVRCVSVEELLTRLGTVRAFSAALVDAGVAGIDRDLIAAARDEGCPVMVVDDPGARDWGALGAAASLGRDFDRDTLIGVLRSGAAPIADAARALATHRPPEGRPVGRLIAVTGPGGTGASSCAIALAQGLATPESTRGHSAVPSVLLADLCRDADQAMLHDARALVPGVPELVDAHRIGVPSGDEVKSLTFEVGARGYRLLLGLRRAHQWTTIAPRALAAALESLRRLADWTIADVEADVEGAAETGSTDVEDRHALGRSAFSHADVTLVVGEPSLKGVHALVRVVDRLRGAGVPDERIVTVVVGAPRSPRARADVVSALRELAGDGGRRSSIVGPVLLPRRPVDRALRDGLAVPGPLPRLLAAATRAAVERVGASAPADDPLPVPVRSVPVLDA